MNRFRLASRFAGLAALAAAACLALTACGGSSASTAAAGAGATPSSSSSLAAFQSCLKAHGVTIRPGAFPSGTPRPFSTATPRPHPTGSFTGRPGGFFSSGADATAFKDCAKYEPADFRGGFGSGFRGVSASAIAAFKSCMSQNGVKITGTTTQQIFASLRNATGKTAAADKTCRVLLQPSGTPTPSPSS